jgi:hypothetical protein
MVYVNNGVTYKVQVNAVLNVTGVPPTRQVNTGAGLTGGGNLSQNITIAVAPGGIGATELNNTSTEGQCPFTFSPLKHSTINLLPFLFIIILIK